MARIRVAFGVPGLDVSCMVDRTADPWSSSRVLRCRKDDFGTYFVTMGARENDPGLYVTFREDEGQLSAKTSGLGLDLASEVQAGRVHVRGYRGLS